MYKLFLAVVSVVCFQCASQKAEVREQIEPCSVLATALNKSLSEMSQMAEQVMSENPGVQMKVGLGRQKCVGAVLHAEIIMQIKTGGRSMSRIALVRLDLLHNGTIKHNLISERDEQQEIQIDEN